MCLSPDELLRGDRNRNGAYLKWVLGPAFGTVSCLHLPLPPWLLWPEWLFSVTPSTSIICITPAQSNRAERLYYYNLNPLRVNNFCLRVCYHSK